jgi:CubicO group peptidase (beta-lactamase class C family)
MYSGGGYTLLQLIIEEVTGEPFASFMQREILAPLGMDDSSFEWNPALQPIAAMPYGVGGRPLPNYRYTARAASGLNTTVISLARFVAAGMTGPDGEPPGRGVLAPATLEEMFSPAAATDGRQGLGYRIEGLPGGTRMVLHGGASKGWKAQIAALPERGAGIVILTNSDLGDDLTADVLCLWSRWATGEVPLICQVVRRERNYALVVAGLLAVGLVACAVGVGAEIRSGRRRLDWTWRRGLFCSLALLDTALWWLLWYTDTVSVVSEVWRDSAPRLLMPATFDWVTWAVTLWGLVVAATCLVPRETEPDAATAPAN